MLSKAEARARGRAARTGLTEPDQAKLAARVLVSCRDQLDWDNYQRVHLFLPVRRQQEINTWPLVEWLWRIHPGIRVCVPRLTAGGIEQVEIGIETRFRRNGYDIPEPLSGHIVPAGTPLDLVLTPLLAFDDAGNRVGYGNGYYDRFLTAHPGAMAVGLAYEAWRIPEGIAAEDHDVRLQAVITDQEMYRYP